MSIRNSEGVISAWESGISALNAWANPVVQELQSIAELNLRTVSAANDAALKGLGTIGNTRTTIQSNTASELVRLFADYSTELGSIVSRLNERLQDVAHAQAEKNEVLARSVMEMFQCRANAASAPLTSVFQTMLSAVPNIEAAARQETEQAIAAARADSPAPTVRARKAVVD
ncbi:Phasin protein [Paraburkholderia piptadeniae]|uniref:Phasin protein n=1 Tax=Paraburkholderia piptadeniae TaxID=1701573 RepID=A0A1N7SWX3_9BURK|nr:phasin family protein [Paraburkholderia piptadeniae]SIT51915.1 Phasin protein [Paraburkholderia piptadeniae]